MDQFEFKIFYSNFGKYTEKLSNSFLLGKASSNRKYLKPEERY
jgi:hypothetical protein